MVSAVGSLVLACVWYKSRQLSSGKFPLVTWLGPRPTQEPHGRTRTHHTVAYESWMLPSPEFSRDLHPYEQPCTQNPRHYQLHDLIPNTYTLNPYNPEPAGEYLMQIAGRVNTIETLTQNGRAMPQVLHARPFVGVFKSQFTTDLSIFDKKIPQNGSKNEETAPRTRTGYPHEGPSGVAVRSRVQ